MFSCSGTQIYDLAVWDKSSGQPWDNDWASSWSNDWSQVYSFFKIHLPDWYWKILFFCIMIQWLSLIMIQCTTSVIPSLQLVQNITLPGRLKCAHTDLVFPHHVCYFWLCTWLTVHHRINFKIASIIFKMLQFQHPYPICSALIPWCMCQHDHVIGRLQYVDVFIIYKPPNLMKKTFPSSEKLKYFWIFCVIFVLFIKCLAGIDNICSSSISLNIF